MIDYKRAWKTLLMTGVKHSFAELRTEFMMTIARGGRQIYHGHDDLRDIVDASELFKIAPELTNHLLIFIGKDDNFKHYYYQSEDGWIRIEYLANINKDINEEYLGKFTIKDHSAFNAPGIVDGLTHSMRIKMVGQETGEVKESFLASIILIGENNGQLLNDEYPSVIKHELTHVLLNALKMMIDDGYYETKIPLQFESDEELIKWSEDISYLRDILEGNVKEKQNFVEFVCEFMMYEVEGCIKVENPMVELKKARKTKSNTKEKRTYRTVTPFERYMEYIDLKPDSYGETYIPILETLRPFYDNYQEFIDEVKV